MTHTPGPWIWFHPPGSPIKCQLVSQTNNDIVLCNITSGDAADRLLIAAAPELLGACKAILPLFSNFVRQGALVLANRPEKNKCAEVLTLALNVCMRGYRDQLTAAITKAEGIKT